MLVCPGKVIVCAVLLGPTAVMGTYSDTNLQLERGNPGLLLVLQAEWLQTEASGMYTYKVSNAKWVAGLDMTW